MMLRWMMRTVTLIMAVAVMGWVRVVLSRMLRWVMWRSAMFRSMLRWMRSRINVLLVPLLIMSLLRWMMRMMRKRRSWWTSVWSTQVG